MSKPAPLARLILGVVAAVLVGLFGGELYTRYTGQAMTIPGFALGILAFLLVLALTQGD